MMKWIQRFRSVLLSGLLAIALVGSADAQSGEQSNCVPEELATALVGPGVPPDATDFFVGELPSGLPDDFVLPDGARVVGGAHIRGSSRMQGLAAFSSQLERSVVVADVPQWSDTAKAEYKRTLFGQGWSEPGFGAQKRQVFQPSASQTPMMLCRKDAILHLSLSVQGDMGARLKISHRTGEKFSRMCNGQQNPTEFMPDVPRPSLEAPSGAVLRPGGGSLGGNSFFAHTRIKSDLKTSELAAHYTDELQGQGWTMKSQDKGGDTVHQTWRFEDESGQTWLGFLIVTTLPDPSEQKVLFHVAKH